MEGVTCVVVRAVQQALDRTGWRNVFSPAAVGAPGWARGGGGEGA